MLHFTVIAFLLPGILAAPVDKKENLSCPSKLKGEPKRFIVFGDSLTDNGSESPLTEMRYISKV